MDGASSVGGGPNLPSETKTPANHFDFGSIALQLTAIEDFHVCYKVVDILGPMSYFIEARYPSKRRFLQ